MLQNKRTLLKLAVVELSRRDPRAAEEALEKITRKRTVVLLLL
jgi:hypothetical protein